MVLSEECLNLKQAVKTNTKIEKQKIKKIPKDMGHILKMLISVHAWAEMS